MTAATFGGVAAGRLLRDGIDVGYRWYQANRVEPAFSFGYGLSYTELRLLRPLGRDRRRAAGSRDRLGHQHRPARRGATWCSATSGTRPSTGEPPRQLRGFERVDLAPGASQVVHLNLTPGDLALWDTTLGSWIVTAGTYRPPRAATGHDLANLPLIRR